MNLPEESDDSPVRVVIDAVGFVRSLINPRSAWGAIVFTYSSEYILLISDEVESEARDVLDRPSITRKFDRISEELKTMLLTTLASADRVKLHEIPKICRDPNDDKVLATAVAGYANYIATEDKDLLELGQYQGIGIVPGVEWLGILRG